MGRPTPCNQHCFNIDKTGAVVENGLSIIIEGK